jgi:hypothetical protein
MEQRDRHVVSVIPVSHMQMCMHAVVIDACEGPAWPELHADPASAAHVATTTAFHLVRMSGT